jgi:hypothetical protein
VRGYRYDLDGKALISNVPFLSVSMCHPQLIAMTGLPR